VALRTEVNRVLKSFREDDPERSTRFGGSDVAEEVEITEARETIA